MVVFNKKAIAYGCDNYYFEIMPNNLKVKEGA